jgi:hypothetical protein
MMMKKKKKKKKKKHITPFKVDWRMLQWWARYKIIHHIAPVNHHNSKWI